MNEEQAIKIAELRLKGSTITLVEDYEELYAISFVNDEYALSGDYKDLKIGAGPMFIEKSTGKVYETGSGRNVTDYIEAFRATGDLYANLSGKALITGIMQPENKSKLTIKLKNLLDLKLSEAKEIFEKVLLGEKIVVDFGSEYDALEKIALLQEFGFVARQLWDTEC